jgi:hypothetical protein
VPGAWLVVSCVPVGTKIRTLAVASSSALPPALMVTPVADCVTSNFKLVYAP